MTSIRVLDGLNTVGGTKIYVEEFGTGVFLDFGMNFELHGRYYDEFLRERVTRGVHDLLKLGLIPEFNIYRKDLIPADVHIHEYQSLPVGAVFITHAHLDHCGYAGLLRGDVPLIASPTTLTIMKTMRDTGKSDITIEALYYKVRSAAGDNPRVLCAPKKAVFTTRAVVPTEPPAPCHKEFWKVLPGGGEMEEFWRLENPLPFEWEAHPVDHSIYGATAYILWTETPIAYTGDMRTQGKNGDLTWAFAKRARSASVLIVEGTRAGDERETVSEREVEERCRAVVEEADGLVIADFGARNFERLETFRDIAARAGRRLVVTEKDIYAMDALGIDLRGVAVYRELRGREDRWVRDVRSRFRHIMVDPLEIRANPSAYVLAFSYYDMKNLLDIDVRGGDYIYSATEPFNEEMYLDIKKLVEWIRLFELRLHGLVVEGGDIKAERGWHASGHISPEDLVRFVEIADPDVIIPVHTKNREWFREMFGERVREGFGA